MSVDALSVNDKELGLRGYGNFRYPTLPDPKNITRTRLVPVRASVSVPVPGTSIPATLPVHLQYARYVENAATDLSMLNQYASLRTTQHPIPSSSPVERLFSLAGLVCYAKRNCLSDCMFETLVLLKVNRQLLYCNCLTNECPNGCWTVVTVVITSDKIIIIIIIIIIIRRLFHFHALLVVL